MGLPERLREQRREMNEPFITLTEYQARALVTWAIANAGHQIGTGAPTYDGAMKVARQVLVKWKEMKR